MMGAHDHKQFEMVSFLHYNERSYYTKIEPMEVNQPKSSDFFGYQTVDDKPRILTI